MAKFASNERLTFTDIRRFTGSIMELAKKAEQYIIDAICETPRSKKEIMEHMGYTQPKSATKIMKPLLENGKLEMTLPDKPKSHNQKYVTKK